MSDLDVLQRELELVRNGPLLVALGLRRTDFSSILQSFSGIVLIGVTGGGE